MNSDKKMSPRLLIFIALTLLFFMSNRKLFADGPCELTDCNGVGPQILLEQTGQWGLAQFDCNSDAQRNVLDLICMVENAVDLDPPVLSALEPVTLMVGDRLERQLIAVDPNGDPLTFGALSLPRNATLDESSGVFTFVPDEEQIGLIEIELVVSDGYLSDQTTLTLIIEGQVDCATAELTTFTSSPADGTRDVAVTRETVLRFSKPLASSVNLDSGVITVSLGQTVLSPVIHRSSDRKTVTLFFPENLPAGARIRVNIEGQNLIDQRGCLVDLDGDGNPGGRAQIEFDTLGLNGVAGTVLTGRVFDAELAVSGTSGVPMNQPIERVRISIDGLEETHVAFTDAKGNFRLENVPAGTFFVHIDGRDVPTSTPGSYYPNVGKPMTAVAGRENPVADIFLPLIEAGTLQAVSQTQATEIRFPASIVNQNPGFEDVALTVPAGALFDPNGSQGGRVGIAPVPPDRLPGPLPEGLDFGLVITVQTDGPQNFDVPAPICFPNLPDPNTGLTLPPGAPSALWSFNHDSGKWEVIGPMTVSADGRLVCSDPGVGVLAPGWHGARPGVQGGGGGPNGQGPPQAEAAKDCEEENGKTDPVYFFSGEFYLDVNDLWIQGRGMDFAWTRKYRSRFGPNSEQGNGWDHGYNLKILEDGILRVFCDGNSRRDRFYPVPGTADLWRRNEYFRDLLKNQDGTYTLHLESNERWHFAALDGGPAQGKIIAKEDRNGNRMGFAYDNQGRLVTITDTLDRDIELTYTPTGQIASVTDFIGREVRYAYYSDGDAGGSPGDLKSVTSPAITGTPNGNDFPDGKTTVYTYSKGFSDERLNHNLLTITDPKGQTFLRNTYETEVPANHPRFDRVVRQAWGNEDDVIDIDYARIEPAPEFASAISRAIVNDRVGNVSEYYYDFGNRQVLMRQFTGRANPDAPTTETENRPTGKLRQTDPDFFETRYEYNNDSLRKRVIYPNGNIKEFVYESDLNPAAPARLRGNLRTIRELPGTHVPAGDQEVIEQHYEYNPDFGCSSCGFNFITRQIDGRGNETLYEYDDRGNRTKVTHRISGMVEEFEYNQFGQLTAHIRPDNGHGIRRRDEYIYSENGPTRGYLSSEIEDADHLALTKTLTRDAVGNVVAITNPRGHTKQIVVNQFNQVIQEITPEIENGSGIRYEISYFYDANDNVVRSDVLNLNEAGEVNTNNPYISQHFEFEILNNSVRIILEIDEGHSTVTEQDYDANRNLIRRRFGEATNGNQPNQTVTSLYDERDLLFRTILAEGHSDQSTDQVDYDGNGNPVRISSGLEAVARVTETTFDGFNRRIAIADAMGNLKLDSYDANSNVIHSQFFGELLDLPGNADNVLLSEQRFTFDLMDRLLESHKAFFESTSQIPFDDGQSSTIITYSHMNQVLSQTDDNGNTIQYEYDSATRLNKVTEPDGNISEYRYDGNDNVVSVTESEVDELGGPNEVFTNHFEFDSLNRQISHTDNVGNQARYLWDSRDNRTVHIDALGNKTLNEFDGLNRLISQTKVLTSDGTGNGVVTGAITIRKVWDDANRLVREIDANNNVSSYGYDPLNRQIRATYADDTSTTRTFDVHGNTTIVVDANGNLISYDYDLLDRETRRDILPGMGVSNETTFETRSYDGLSRLVEVEDNDSLISRTYDSLSNLRSETQNGQLCLADYDGEGNRLEQIYPSGRRVTRSYNPLNHVRTIDEAARNLATFAYVGPIRIKRLELGNDTQAHFSYNGVSGVANQPNDFGERRISQIRQLHQPSQTVIDDRIFTWDRKHNKTMRRNQLNGEEHHYTYDSIYRMTESERLGQAPITYDFDQVHNRLSVVGGPQGGLYELDNRLPDPGDAQMNQYSATPFDRRDYDDEGNLTQVEVAVDRQISLVYDYRNQLVQVVDQGKGIVANYDYDGLGRRIGRHVDEGSGLQSTLYVYQGSHVIEEQDENNLPVATYVYGVGLDQIISMRRNNQDFYYHLDDLNNVVALSDDSGTVVERYEYADYGMPSFSDGHGNALENSLVDNPYLFNGRRFDPETSLYYYRTRYLDPAVGRFISRDTIGTWGDATNLGNSFTYAGNNPWSRIDPMGEAIETGWDVASLSLGLTAMAYNYSNGNYGWLFLDTLGVAVDTAAAFTPWVPGGAGTGFQVMRGVSYVEKVRRTQVGVQMIHATVDLQTAVNSYRDPCATLRERALNTVFAMVGINGLKAPKGPRNKGNDVPPTKTYCFAPGTLVLMADGSTKAIEHIQAGEMVWADNPEDDQPAGPTQVLGRVPGRTLRFIKLHIDEDADGLVDGTIEATGEHPFYTNSGDWVLAEQLRPGVQLFSDSGCETTVLATETVIGLNTTYNLNTANVDTFYVVINNSAILVHNNEFYKPGRKLEIVRYGDKNSKFRNHHPWWDAWLEKALKNVDTLNKKPLYKSRENGFPTIKMTDAEHSYIHNKVAPKWMKEWKKANSGSGISKWSELPGPAMNDLAETMLKSLGYSERQIDTYVNTMVDYFKWNVKCN